MKCEICGERQGEYRHKEEGESFCKKCLKKEFNNMSFEDYLEDVFIKEGGK